MPQSVPQVTHAELVIIVNYMADHNYTANEIAYAVEKPWKHVDVLEEARKELAE